ncbi:MAG: DNA-binding protein WhiA, partial [Bacillota bacterium]|nr:DNA-binding protein WhiA [Bacillota bacterium]
MSFSSDIKSELAQIMPDRRCCMLAEISGILRTCGSIRLAGLNKINYRLVTENAAAARKIIRLMKEYFGIRLELVISKNMMLKKNNFYEMIISEDMRCQEILRETGILKVQDGFNVFDYGIDERIIKKKCCKKAFLRGAFLGSGSITDPEKAYHMEIVTANPVLAKDIIKLMGQFKLKAKDVVRKDTTVVYIKDSSQISDFLNITGAHKALLELENVKLLKEIVNRTNRLVNCDNANMDKTLAASEKQIAAIEKIFSVKSPDWLPPKLREIALLRVEEREASL